MHKEAMESTLGGPRLQHSICNGVLLTDRRFHCDPVGDNAKQPTVLSSKLRCCGATRAPDSAKARTVSRPPTTELLLLLRDRGAGRPSGLSVGVVRWLPLRPAKSHGSGRPQIGCGSRAKAREQLVSPLPISMGATTSH